MRRWASARTSALALAIATPAFAGTHSPLPDGPPPHGGYIFAGVPWLTPADSAVAALAVHGYVEQPNSREKSALHCTGKLFDRFAIVEGALDDKKRLIRCQISIPSASQGDPYVVQRKIYDDAVKEMEAKYGRRRGSQDRFRFPYEKGDGRQAQALREGYATVRSEWGSAGHDHLVIELDRASAVVFTYESPWWQATESDRLKTKAKDL